MNKHLKHIQLIRLIEHIDDTREFCTDPWSPLHALLISGLHPIDMQDKATQRFFELMDYDHSTQNLNVSSFRTHVINCLSRMEHDLTEEKSLTFQEFLLQGEAGEDWTQLNALFQHLTGTSLSVIVDVSDVLMRPDDNGLDGEEWFSANLQVARLDGDQSSLMVFGVAIASTLDQLLLLIKDEVLRRDDSYASLRKKRMPSSMYVSSDIPENFEPAFVEIKRNNELFLGVPIGIETADGEFEASWERTAFSQPSREATLAIAAVAPRRVAHKLKGRQLYDELGL
jgi:hypothetical protein